MREPKPRVPVSNVWDPEDLRGRPTTWKESVKLRRGDCRRPGTMGETLSYQKRATDMRYCRSKMMHERRSNDILEAFERQQALDDAQKVRRPGTSAPPSTVATVTHQLFEQMRPTYGMNDTFATVTTSQLIGMGATTAPAAGSDYAKPRGDHDARWVTRNGADRLQTEAALHEVQNRKPEPPAPSLVDTLRSKRAAATAASTGGGPRGGFHSLGGGDSRPRRAAAPPSASRRRRRPSACGRTTCRSRGCRTRRCASRTTTATVATFAATPRARCSSSAERLILLPA